MTSPWRQKVVTNEASLDCTLFLADNLLCLTIKTFTRLGHDYQRI